MVGQVRAIRGAAFPVQAATVVAPRTRFRLSIPALAAVALGLVALSLAAAEADASETYWISPLAQTQNAQTTAFSNSAAAPVAVTLYDGMGGGAGSLSVPAGGSVTTDLPGMSWSVPYAGFPGTIYPQTAYQAVASGPVEVTTFARFATRILPDTHIGKTYHLFASLENNNNQYPYFVVIAATQPTFVTVAIPGKPTVTNWLNTRDVWGISSYGDPSGALVQADGIVAVWSGNIYGGYAWQQIGNQGPQSALWEQMWPVELAGTEHVLCSPEPIDPAWGTMTYVISTVPWLTTITIEPVGITTGLAGVGSVYSIVLTEDVVIKSSDPVLVGSTLDVATKAAASSTLTAQVGPGNQNLVIYGPTMSMRADHPFESGYYGGNGAADFQLQKWVLVAAPFKSNVLLDGTTLALDEVGTSGWGCGRAEVAPGYHRVLGTEPLAASVLGISQTTGTWFDTLGMIVPEVPPVVPPTPVFKWDPTKPACGLPSIQFTDGSAPGSSAIVAWTWDFGDGQTSTDQNPLHAYEEPGAYSVKQTVMDANGETAEYKTDVLVPGPIICIPSTLPEDNGRAPRAPHDGVDLALAAGDFDEDGVADRNDNCPATANAGQEDADFDLQGDVCDEDADNDAIANTVDSCRLVPNPGQGDIDGDGRGDACDTDADGDGVSNTPDNCPATSNADQVDADADQVGDACQVSISVPHQAGVGAAAPLGRQSGVRTAEGPAGGLPTMVPILAVALAALAAVALLARRRR